MADEMTPEMEAAAREGFLANPVAVAYALSDAAGGATAGTAVVNVGGERYPVRVTLRAGDMYVEVWRPVGDSWVRTVFRPELDGAGGDRA